MISLPMTAQRRRPTGLWAGAADRLRQMNEPFVPNAPLSGVKSPPSETMGAEAIRATGTGPFDAAYRQNLAVFGGGTFTRPGGMLSFDPTGADPFGGTMPETLIGAALKRSQPFGGPGAGAAGPPAAPTMAPTAQQLFTPAPDIFGKGRRKKPLGFGAFASKSVVPWG